jgi:formylglycine-generating enzyme required for sulfatase activity
MHGNVSEWTLDQYQEDFYAQFKDSLEVSNPWSRPTKLHPRSVRGGSWDDAIEDHRCASRIRSSSKWKERDPQIPKSFWWNTDSPFVGFRIVRPYKQMSKSEQEVFWMDVLGG